MEKYILALDQGTTSSRGIVFSSNGKIVSVSQYPFTQYFPIPGYVEHDPEEIAATEFRAASEAVEKASAPISCIGITNQRETVIVWEKKTGKPVYNAVVWQCRRTADMCEELISEGWYDKIKAKTGLGIDAYFSGTKIKWILEHIENGITRAKNGELLCGNVDCYLIYRLTGGKVHATDYTNASRTMLFNINTLEWDKEICDLLEIPMCMLPEVKDCAGIFGYVDAKKSGVSELLDNVPISGVAGDQQAALFGQACFNKGDVKNTYGTGCFTLMNVGEKPVESPKGLVSTIGWKIKNEVIYALEGSVFNAGSSVQWLRDNLGIIKNASDTEAIALSVKDSGGVYFVSAFTGLGAPYWDMYARGNLSGITRGTTSAQIVRAVLEGIDYQVCDLVSAMEAESGIKINVLNVDGGASVNDFLMQFQTDVLGVRVDRPEIVETTAMGAAFLAGLGIGIWNDKSEIRFARKTSKVYEPQINAEEREELKKGWRNAVARCLSDIENR